MKEREWKQKKAEIRSTFKLNFTYFNWGKAEKTQRKKVWNEAKNDSLVEESYGVFRMLELGKYYCHCRRANCRKLFFHQSLVRLFFSSLTLLFHFVLPADGFFFLSFSLTVSPNCFFSLITNVSARFVFYSLLFATSLQSLFLLLRLRFLFRSCEQSFLLFYYLLYLIV